MVQAKNESVIKRLMQVVESPHWYASEFFMPLPNETTVLYYHYQTYSVKVHKRKYGLRKRKFTEYESHRGKKFFDQLPF